MSSFTVGELADRLSIVTLKMLFLPDTVDIISEYKTLKRDLDDTPVNFQDMVELISANMVIWGLERDLRMGKENLMTLEEVGRRAILIRDTNSKRCAIKNKISRDYNQGVEVKDVWGAEVPEDNYWIIAEETGVDYESVKKIFTLLAGDL